ncbi:MAG: alanine racemase [Muribaculaceae bacterium]|nr:alanine racemase [Muribaculaceae bacterium]
MTLTQLLHNHGIKRVSTDSRAIIDPANTVFVAIRTDIGDGHDYIMDASAMGVTNFVINSDYNGELPPDANIIRTADTLEALEQLGAEARELAGDIPVVGITGSRGKTVVKEMIVRGLMESGKTVAFSPRSWNSRIGVPLALRRAAESTPHPDMAVFEAGIDSSGQMVRHARILRPTVGVFTNVTEQDHSAGFESISEKAREKALLFTGCHTVIYNSSDPEVTRAVKALEASCRLIPVDTWGMTPHRADTALARATLLALGVPAPERFSEVESRLNIGSGARGNIIATDGLYPTPEALEGALDFLNRQSRSGKETALILGSVNHPAGQNPYPRIEKMVKDYGITHLIRVTGADALLQQAFPGTAAVKDTTEFMTVYPHLRHTDCNILICGEGTDGLDSFLEAPRHDTRLEINLSAVRANFNHFREKLRDGARMIAMVKADAYGTGAVEVARQVVPQGAAYLAVAVVNEAVKLRAAGIDSPIILLNPISSDYQAVFLNRVEPTIFSAEELDTYVEWAARMGVKDYPVHIKLDTGMHRLGFAREDISALAERLRENPYLRVSTVFSHLATADTPVQEEYTRQQLELFREMSTELEQRLGYGVKRHILNTAGLMRFPRHHYDYVRLGIGLYGISPSAEVREPLALVASLRTTVIALRSYQPGETVGYGRHGLITRPSVIATLPIGYADGLDRHLGRGAAEFMVRGVKCPTIGNICMDLCMIDVTDIPDVHVGDSVEIFGPQMPIEKLAETLGTIPYEILAGVSPRVKRQYFTE